MHSPDAYPGHRVRAHVCVMAWRPPPGPKGAWLLPRTVRRGGLDVQSSTLHARIQSCRPALGPTYMYTHVRTLYIYIYILHVNIYMCTYMYTCMYVCIYIRVYDVLHICTHILRPNSCTHSSSPCNHMAKSKFFFYIARDVTQGSPLASAL